MAGGLVHTWWSQQRWWNGALVVSFGIGLMARLHFALTDLGMNWPDEIHQSLEPAHRIAFGYGFVAWEFVEGARNIVFPAFLAGVLKLLRRCTSIHPASTFPLFEYSLRWLAA